MENLSDPLNEIGYDQNEVDGSGATSQKLFYEIASQAYKDTPDLEKFLQKRNLAIFNGGHNKGINEPTAKRDYGVSREIPHSVANHQNIDTGGF